MSDILHLTQATDHSMLQQVVDYEEQKKLVMDRISVWQELQVFQREYLPLASFALGRIDIRGWF